MSGIVQIKCLGSMGRLGNQLFQYALAKAYARSIGATLETPAWIGQQLFQGIDDPPLSKEFPSAPMDCVPISRPSNINLHGYFQHTAAFDLYTLSDLREWFIFRPHWHEEMRDYSTPLPLVAHIRRGDYVTTYPGDFCIIDEAAYLAAFSKFGYRSDVCHWVREDKPTVFKRPGLEWLIDFWTLMRAETLFRANSTFSWWASTIGFGGCVYSPVVDGLRGHHSDVPFILGNSPRPTDQPNVHDFNIKP